MTNLNKMDGLRIAELVNTIAGEVTSTQRAQLEQDWRSFLERSFTITDGQRDWLRALIPSQVQFVAALIQDTLASKGAERIVVAYIPDPSKAGGLIHELRKEAVIETQDNMRSNIVIAHCDANCQNWGWGPG
jgi:hypothetical protein